MKAAEVVQQIPADVWVDSRTVAHAPAWNLLTQIPQDLLLLAQCRHGVRQKISLFRTYIALGMSRLAGAGERRYRVLQWRIWSFRAATLRFLFREIFVHGSYSFLSATSKPVIVDCGANIGMSVLYFKWLYPGAEIHAFEPDPATFQVLRRNVQENSLPNVYLYNSAVGALSGRMDFFVDDGEPGSLLMSTDPSRMSKRRITVPAVALSEVVAKRSVDLVKLDIEGAEVEVLGELADQGALDRVSNLVIEYHHQIPGRTARLAAFLGVLEDHAFCYTLAAKHPLRPDQFQDIMICARKL